MKQKLTIECEIEIVEKFKGYGDTTVARVYYPDEGNTIQIKKGLNIIEFSEAIHHEIGHLFDWYLSEGNQSGFLEVREENAIVIGESLRNKKVNG